MAASRQTRRSVGLSGAGSPPRSFLLRTGRRAMDMHEQTAKRVHIMNRLQPGATGASASISERLRAAARHPVGRHPARAAATCVPQRLFRNLGVLGAQDLDQFGVGRRELQARSAPAATPTASPDRAGAPAHRGGRSGGSAARRAAPGSRARSRGVPRRPRRRRQLLAQLARPGTRRAIRPARTCRPGNSQMPSRWTPSCRRVTRKRTVAFDDRRGDDDRSSCLRRE